MRPLRPSGRLHRLLIGAVAAALALSAVPRSLDAQTRTAGRNFSIAYESGNASRNGYMDAQVQVTYYFGVCAGQVAFLATYNATPHMLVGNHRYWVDGRQVSVPPHIRPPRIESPTVRGTIRGPNTVRDINYLWASPAASPSCLTNDLGLGPTSSFWPAGTPQDRQLAILNQFGLDYRGTLPPLRNAEVESHFRQIFAQERTDSLNRARAAEQQRLAARRDSIARAQAARTRQDSLARAEAQRRAASTGAATSPGSTAGAGAAAAGSSGTAAGAGSSGAQRPMSPAERDAALQAEREAAAEAAARDARIRQQHAAEQARLRAEQEEQLVEAVQATTIAALGLFEAIAESRRENAEKRRVRDELARRQAAAAYAAYVATTKARFDAAPPRPACSVADVRDSLIISSKNQERTLRLSGEECRLSQGQSAILMTLVVDSDAPVSISASTSPVIATLHLVNEGLNTAVTSRLEGGFTAHVERGRYILVVSSRLPGEVGDVKLAARTLWISDAQGTLGGAGGAAQPIEGFVGTNQTSSSFMDLNWNLQHRRGWPYLTMTMLLATDTEAAEAMFDVGLRQYLGPTTSRFQPWVEASLGYRNISVREQPFTTISPAFGAGVHMRLSPGYGVALSATQITGKATNSEDIWTSPPPPVPLNRTIFRLGLMLY